MSACADMRNIRPLIRVSAVLISQTRRNIGETQTLCLNKK